MRSKEGCRDENWIFLPGAVAAAGIVLFISSLYFRRRSDLGMIFSALVGDKSTFIAEGKFWHYLLLLFNCFGVEFDLKSLF